MRQTRSAGVLLFRQAPEESFLLMRHRDRWDLPKGHLDPGETDRQAALRELEEETGLRSDQVRLDPEFQFRIQYQVRYARYGDEVCLKTVTIFLAEMLQTAPIRPTEHEDFAWFAWNPPHRIQEQTIDPLLEAVEKFRSG